MKKMAIIVAVFMMIVGAAVSVMKTLELGPFAPSAEEKASATEGEEEGGGDQAAAPAASGPPLRFVDVEPLNIPVFHEDRVATTIQITLKLEVVDSKNEALVKQMLPRLNDAFVRDMHAFIPRLLKQEERLNVVIIKKRLQIVAERLVGKELISNILVQSVTDTARPGKPTQ